MPVTHGWFVVCEECLGESGSFENSREAAEEERLWMDESGGECLCCVCRDPKHAARKRKDTRDKIIREEKARRAGVTPR